MIQQLTKKLFSNAQQRQWSKQKVKRKSRWRKIDIIEKVDNPIANQSLLKLKNFIYDLTRESQIDNLLIRIDKQLTTDLYFIRCIKEDQMSILKLYIKEFILILCTSVKPKHSQIFFSIISQIIQIPIKFLQNQVYTICNTFLNIYQASTQKNLKKFIPFNFSLYKLIVNYPFIIDCTLLTQFFKIYNNLGQVLQRLEATQTLLFLIKSKDNTQKSFNNFDRQSIIIKKNIILIDKIYWTRTLLNDVCNKLTESIKYLCENYDQNYDNQNDSFYERLIPKFIQHIQYSGFVSENKLFQEGFQIFDVESVINMLISLKLKDPFGLQILLQLFKEYDYYPHSTINALKIYMHILELQNQLNSQEFNQFIQQLISLHHPFQNKIEYINQVTFAKNVECQNQIIFSIKSNGFISLILNFIHQLKWDWLPLIEILLSKKHCPRLQLYLLKNDLINFLIQNLMKKKISLQYIKVSYNILGLLIQKNKLCIIYLHQKINSPRQRKQFIELISKQIDKSYNFILNLFTCYKYFQQIKQNQPNAYIKKKLLNFNDHFLIFSNYFKSKLVQWFISVSLLKPDSKNKLEIITLKIIICISIQDLQDLIRSCLLWNMSSQMQKIEFINDLQQWQQYYDHNCRLKLERKTGSKYYKLRKEIEVIKELFKQIQNS